MTQCSDSTSRLSRQWWRLLAVVMVGAQLVVLYLPSTPQPQGTPLPPGLDKVVHVAIFAAVTFTLLQARPAWGSPRYRTAVLVGLSALHAPLSEVIQHVLLPHRSGDFRDVLADLAGVAVGWLAWHVTRRAHARRSSGSAPHRQHADR